MAKHNWSRVPNGAIRIGLSSRGIWNGLPRVNKTRQDKRSGERINRTREESTSRRVGSALRAKRDSTKQRHHTGLRLAEHRRGIANVVRRTASERNNNIPISGSSKEGG